MNIQQMTTTNYVQSAWSKQAAKNGRSLTGLQMRAFRNTEDDFEAIVAIENANHPDSPISMSEYRFYDEAWDPKYMRERVIAEQNGRVLGFATYGQPWWSFKEGKYFFFIHVHPDWHESIVAAALLDLILEKLQAHQPTLLTSEVRESHQYIVDLLQSRGYEAVMRVPVSVLDVPQFDPGRFAAVEDRVKESGICIDNLRIVAEEDPEWQMKLYDLEWEILQDVPTPELLTRLPFDQWQKRVLESPNFAIDGQIVARDGERFVGMSGLWTSEANPKKLYTGLTGVIRSHRRRGLATTMKVEGIRFAQAKGVELIETDNEENNPMLDLNKQLGFREKPASVSYEKRLEFGERKKELIKEPL